MMDILMSETCWAHKKWNKIASDIKLVFYSSTILQHNIGLVKNSHGCLGRGSTWSRMMLSLNRLWHFSLPCNAAFDTFQSNSLQWFCHYVIWDLEVGVCWSPAFCIWTDLLPGVPILKCAVILSVVAAHPLYSQHRSVCQCTETKVQLSVLHCYSNAVACCQLYLPYIILLVYLIKLESLWS